MALIISAQVDKQLASMPKVDRERIVRRLGQIAADPSGRHPGVPAMAGKPGAFRVRQGDWRAIFRIDGEDVVVIRVWHRSEVYE